MTRSREQEEDEEDPRVAFIHETNSTFIMQDLRLLGEVARVADVRFAKIADIPKLVRAISRSQVVFVWFAAGRAAALSTFVGKLLRKRVIIVAGGTEVSRDPRFRGTSIRSRLRFQVAVLAINAADLVTCVSEFTRKEVESVARPRECRVIYNGVDTMRLNGGDLANKEKGDSILTIQSGALWLKGIDRFVRVAQILPHRSFLIAGPVRDSELPRQTLPQNITLVGRLGPDELLPLLQSARFYCQLSRYESFGVALVEAMACECAPIASGAGALAEVVNGTGFLVPDGDPEVVATLIEANWSAAPDIGRSARERVVRSFSSERRKDALRSMIQDIL
jgi:glycosyltransferase involved in cell wall biosynthesis